MNLQDNLIKLQGQSQKNILFRLSELLLFAMTAHFLKDENLYRCFYTAIFIYIQGLMIFSYYHYLIVKYLYDLRRNQYSGFIFYLQRLNNFNSEELNRDLQFYHTYFYLMKFVYWMQNCAQVYSFEIIFFLFVPFEIMKLLQQSFSYFNCLLLLELLIHLVRRFNLIILPLVKLLILFYSFIRPLPRQQHHTQQQLEPLKIEIVPQNAELECNICLEMIENEVVRLKCNENHTYHEKCIRDWIILNPTCPQCRKEI